MAPNGQDSGRTRRLAKELQKFLNGTRKVLGIADAKLFLEALLLEVNPRRCVETIFSSKAKLDPISESSIIKIFTTATNHETRSNGYKIEKILQTKLSKQPNKSAFSPGGRHDNDFEDFRKIRIYPTTDEFLSTKQQYYLQSKEVEEKSESDRTLAHLENQFRLLREDMLGELRTGLQVALGKKKGRSLGISLGNLSIAGLNMDGEQPCLALHCGLGLERLTKLDMTVRKKFLMDSKNFLKHDSFGALLGENDIHSFAHVNRDVDYLLRDPPVVLLQFPEDESFKRALMALKTFRDLRFTLVNTPVFAYQPILESLKKRTEVPIDQNLLFLANGETTFQPLPAQKLMAEKIMAGRRDDGSVKTRIDGKRIELDETQAQSVINGLICPLTVIRGPPGTGKSFLGSFLVKLILKYTDLKILVVSFKNHALDDFLEELLNLGVNPQDMVRLGSKARSTVRTEPLLLHHQKNSRSSETWGMINALDPEVDELKEELQRAFHEFGIGTHSLSWNDIQDYLEMNEEDRLYYDALTIPEENDGWNRVAKKNKRIAKQAFPSVWAMPMNSRSDLVRKWTRSLFEERVELIQDLYKRYTEVQEKLNSLRLEGKIATLRNMRVIGCTTTIAAKQNKLIRGANPDIVLQHRMHPEISVLIRELTYPDLIDGPNTTDRERPRGIQGRVVFVNHTHPEIEPPVDIVDRRDPERTSSKQNDFEAKMVLKLVRYLSQHNYQGEESDIVIVSLTRSNEKGEIGFMDAPERLNVLLSRARCCLIMIGSEETFMASKKGGAMWTKFLQSLKAKKCLHDGVPVRCEKHPEKEYLLKEPADFDRCCPDGGCSEPCKANDTCRKCVQAQKELERRTRRDFELEKHRLEDLERRTRRDFELEKHRLEVQARYAEELKAIQDETEHHKRLNKIAEEEKQAKRNLDQSKADLEALKEASARSNALKAAEKKRELEREKRKAEQQTKTPARAPSKDPNQPWSPPATAKEEWELLKQTDLARSGPMDELMEMIGLEDVKQEFLSIKSRVDTAVRQGVSLSKERFGCSLLGNPGTGKTTVARLYAKFLTSVGVIAGTKFEETTGSALANKGVTGCQKLLDDVLNEGGGVIFIDEAYQLTSGNSSGGGAVLDFLLPEVENLTGKIVFVLAGYDKEMESFFSHNPGLPSRFPTNLKFADYTDVELLQILELKINSRYREAMKVEGGLKGLYCRVITRRIGRGRGRPGFGNARAVENTLAIIIKRQAVRLRKERLALALGKPQPDDLLFTKEDVIGPEPSEALRASASWKKLSKLIGLKAVKEAVTSLCDSIVENYKRELEEKPPIEYNLNRVFLGNPGTGKTTVGKLYAGVLGDLGLLSKGDGKPPKPIIDMVLKTPSDFVGSALGHSEQQTKGILAAAEGKVLIIDEAYGLYGGGGVADPYKTAVIDTIVGEVQSVPGDDRCVLLLGYKDQMEEMFQNVNPGLSRRFPMASAFQFDDFDDSELGQILDLKLKDQSFEITDQARTVALEMLNRARNRPNFGNAGEIDILLNTAKARHQTRRTQGLAKYVTKFEAKDFDEDFDRANRSETNVKELFRGTVGQEAIMALLEGYQQTVRTMKNLDLDAKENIPFNFLFRGPPGTGKTTTARKMGKVFYDMGFLATAELIDVSATDLIGQYVGQTGPKVQQLLDKALGKVLFVDEAYRLGEGHFAKEAMDELVDCTTKTKYHKKLVIILAGYEKDINSLMSTNPGLTSRFPEVINFRGLTPVECFTLLTSTLSTQKKVLLSKKVDMDISALENSSEKFRNDMLIHFQILAQLDNWASARDVQTLSKSIFNRAIQNPDDIKRGQIRISGDLIQSECSALISERQSRGQSSMGNILPSVPLREYQVQNPRPPTKTTTRTTSTITKESQTQPEEEQIDSTPTQELAVTDKPKYPTPQRDAGVSDAIWEQLQRDQQAELEKEEEYKALIKARDDATDAERDEIVKRLLEEEARRKKEAEMKEKLALMGRCPVGYEWIKQAGGYRCAGGSHFLSNGQLGV
ncbi:putative protein CbxX, chromosomal [Glarea lozoyensis 74030]|uniref:AAA+ ATPase domain-containing protein n=1 Tax=Glarea lozoyensis (strain ATCC 74030 / MF5533) TaxID=1104152 RepID=H0EZ98_GLAL7|nr:putative protein CbxX, chromosomal [Glarea lozoyensis 74030]